ncbi:spermidine/spermine N(1)-acetyltransferase-like protein 1 [Ochotona curzoniae]|uniref:spermidine/spermine N(1)-acetyltransferase-like protein 1 n=1 Tax=Ochotona curzoniae TaxID=130825 RepID=UPI001B34A663|nr:spermidine/spermine N(1)-acetyltransferase-like protein 1 [Ochotona curzoniae]
MRPLQIRPAEARDCPEIMRLIKELATCDNKRGVTNLTIAGLDPYCPPRLQKYGFLPPLLSGMENCRDLLRDGFGDNPLFYCLIAEVYNSRKPSGRTAVGFAIYYFKYTLWTGKLLYLEDFYVIKAYQGLGIGDEMLKRLSQIALRTQCKGMHFLVVIWNRASAEYYCRRGASDISSEEGRHLFKFTYAQLTEIAK